ncbi:Uncharacterised protein [Vibrio cholerae]|nr:Uncharacterised protein [Vibrio cholerae]CSC93716.1 Uncharacterised protein [Vibrio cholerae]
MLSPFFVTGCISVFYKINFLLYVRFVKRLMLSTINKSSNKQHFCFILGLVSHDWPLRRQCIWCNRVFLMGRDLKALKREEHVITQVSISDTQ